MVIVYLFLLDQVCIQYNWSSFEKIQQEMLRSQSKFHHHLLELEISFAITVFSYDNNLVLAYL